MVYSNALKKLWQQQSFIFDNFERGGMTLFRWTMKGEIPTCMPTPNLPPTSSFIQLWSLPILAIEWLIFVLSSLTLKPNLTLEKLWKKKKNKTNQNCESFCSQNSEETKQKYSMTSKWWKLLVYLIFTYFLDIKTNS